MAELKEPSQKAKNLSSRLMAAQVIYQALYSKSAFSSVLDEYMAHRIEMDVDGETILKPDGVLLKKIVKGAEERQEDLQEVILANSGQKNLENELLISAILLCGSYELMAHDEVDTGIIINDYLNVGHSFFDQGEVKLINAILDSIAKAFRSAK